MSEQVKDKLQDGFEKARDAISKNEQVLVSRTYQLSTGALALSFTVFSFLFGKMEMQIDSRAAWICCGYILCIFLDTISFVISRQSFINVRDEFAEKIKRGETDDSTSVNKRIRRANRVTWAINYFVYLLLFTNMVLTIILIKNLIK